MIKVRNNAILVTGLCIFVVLYYTVICGLSFNKAGSIAGLNYNITAYIASVLLSLLLCGILCRISEHIKRFDKTGGKYAAVNSAVCVVFIIIALIYLWMIYAKESTLYGGGSLAGMFIRENSRVNHILFTAAMLLVIAGITLVLSDMKAISRKFRLIFSVQIAIACSFFSFAANMMRIISSVHSYTNSIVSVASFNAYSGASSIYGHYALIFMPFVKLFGNNLEAIAITVSIFTLAFFLAAFFIADKLIENDLHFGITVIAIASIATTFYTGNGSMILLPHTVLFPVLAVVLTYITGKDKRLTKRETALIEIFFGAIAIMFDLKSGICAALTLAVYHTFENKTDIKHILITLVRHLIYCASSFVLAYLLVNLYNLAAGGVWQGVGEFIYPDTSKLFTSPSSVSLHGAFAKYTIYIVVFILACFSSATDLLKGEANDEQRHNKLLTLTLAASGIFSLISVFDSISVSSSAARVQFVILLSFYASRFVHCKKTELLKLFKSPSMLFSTYMSGISFMLVTWIALEGIVGAGATFGSRTWGGVWDGKSQKKSIGVFADIVPKDTLAFGKGIPELYFELGWDPQIITNDWNNISRESIMAVKKAINECDAFVTTKANVITIPEDFKLYEEIETDDFKCLYYVRKTAEDYEETEANGENNA